MKHLSRIFVILLIIALGCVGLLLIGHHHPIPEKGKKSITILTYNTHRMGEFKHAKKNEVIMYLQQQSADIVCLQEVEVYHSNNYLTLNELKQSLSKYDYTYFDFSVHNNKRQYGNAVFSKYPLINKRTVHYTSRANISSRCDVVVGHDTLRLLNNHLESNRLIRLDTTTLNKLDAARTIRNKQARVIRQEIRQSPYPVIVAGDFNSIPLSYAYLTIRGFMHDCFLDSHWGGLGNTFVRHGLGIRIDYLLCSRTLTPLRSEVKYTSGSDHYPLWAQIALPK